MYKNRLIALKKEIDKAYNFLFKLFQNLSYRKNQEIDIDECYDAKVALNKAKDLLWQLENFYYEKVKDE